MAFLRSNKTVRTRPIGLGATTPYGARMDDFAADARTATLALRTLFPETPLQRNDHLSKRHAAEIWLKREDLSPVRSYKLRGAFTAMARVRRERPDRARFVCASAGNHAQGVAFAGRHFGVESTIFMPVTTPQQKIDKTRAFGGDGVHIVLTGDYFDQTLAAAQAWCEAEGAEFLSPFDNDDVILGQASVGVEMLDQLGRSPDLVVLPVGGGGLASGVTGYLRSASPATVFRFVEPAGGASLTAALRDGAPTRLRRINSFVDGAAVAQIGARNFARLNWVGADAVLLAPEDRICVTMLEMLNVEGIVLEPAGALALDVLPELADDVATKIDVGQFILARAWHARDPLTQGLKGGCGRLAGEGGDVGEVEPTALIEAAQQRLGGRERARQGRLVGAQGALNEDALAVGQPTPARGAAGVALQGEEELKLGQVAEEARVARVVNHAELEHERAIDPVQGRPCCVHARLVVEFGADKCLSRIVDGGEAGGTLLGNAPNSGDGNLIGAALVERGRGRRRVSFLQLHGCKRGDHI